MESSQRVSVPLGGPRGALVVALTEGLTVAEAARRAGVTARTAYRYLRRPEVKSALREARGEILDRVVARLANLVNPALTALGHLVVHSQNEAIRLGSAKAILEFGLRYAESVALSDRIKDLEQALAEPRAAAAAVVAVERTGCERRPEAGQLDNEDDPGADDGEPGQEGGP